MELVGVCGMKAVTYGCPGALAPWGNRQEDCPGSNRRRGVFLAYQDPTSAGFRQAGCPWGFGSMSWGCFLSSWKTDHLH